MIRTWHPLGSESPEDLKTILGIPQLAVYMEAEMAHPLIVKEKVVE